MAGGSGARFGAKKQFLDLCGRPVLAHAARSFLDHPAVGRVVVVVPPDDMGAAEALFGAEAPRLVVAEGGASRCESVARGSRTPLRAAPCSSTTACGPS
ncbi:MAG TPA: 2-C-methyl-D-erythritol 4-phosphate cytidylyltransferase [Deltaproteobacteria bacterium]|nr:2-C-methyl-D-erythritol 4-phosphate cytidylyltransferase [Deltaproteobacteria bacterium]